VGKLCLFVGFFPKRQLGNKHNDTANLRATLVATSHSSQRLFFLFVFLLFVFVLLSQLEVDTQCVTMLHLSLHVLYDSFSFLFFFNFFAVKTMEDFVGAAIARGRENPSWTPLESNPDALNQFARGMGLPASVAFTDCFGLDEDLLGFLPQPVLAMILLFPYDNQVFSLKERWFLLCNSF
jgi:hypothetical protein